MVLLSILVFFESLGIFTIYISLLGVLKHIFVRYYLILRTMTSVTFLCTDSGCLPSITAPLYRVPP